MDKECHNVLVYREYECVVLFPRESRGGSPSPPPLCPCTGPLCSHPQLLSVRWCECGHSRGTWAPPPAHEEKIWKLVSSSDSTQKERVWLEWGLPIPWAFQVHCTRSCKKVLCYLAEVDSSGIFYNAIGSYTNSSLKSTSYSPKNQLNITRPFSSWVVLGNDVTSFSGARKKREWG